MAAFSISVVMDSKALIASWNRGKLQFKEELFYRITLEFILSSAKTLLEFFSKISLNHEDEANNVMILNIPDLTF